MLEFLNPKRRRLRARIRRLYRQMGETNLVAHKCPECRFKCDTPVEWPYAVCPWCGLGFDVQPMAGRAHGF